MFLLLATAALAYESTPNEVVFSDLTDLYDGATSSTGWVPSGSPIAIRIQNSSAGGAYVEMEGESWLEWPEPLTHTYAPDAGSGVFLLDTELGLAVDLKFDIGGYALEQTLYESLDIYEGEAFFDPWLLPNGDPQVAEIAVPGADQELFSYSQAIVAGVEVYVDVNWRSDLNADFTGIQIATGEHIIDAEGTSQLLEVPVDGAVEELAVFTGEYGAKMDLVFVPAFGVCIPIIGCTEVGAFDIPVPVVDTGVVKEFEPVNLYHPLPVAVVLTDACDFGEVEVGQIATCEVKVANWGEMELEGTAGVQGAGEFTVFPGEVFAREDLEDGLTVTFSPTVAGEQASVLILNTSDPAALAYEIPLSGIGWEEEEEPPVTITSEVGTCGCSSQTGTESLAWLTPLAGLLLLRRRRRRA